MSSLLCKAEQPAAHAHLETERIAHTTSQRTTSKQ